MGLTYLAPRMTLLQGQAHNQNQNLRGHQRCAEETKGMPPLKAMIREWRYESYVGNAIVF